MHRIESIKDYIVLLLCLTALAISAQEIPLPGDEAPTSIFDTRIGDSDVDILIDGSWRIQSSLGGIWGSPSPVSPTVPGFSSGFMFDQLPDLTLSLWLMERYFFETTFTEEELFNTWLLGYEGREGEFLRRVRIGNTATSIDSTPLTEVPEHPEDALGVSATMETGKSRHELLFRYQKTSRVTKEYRGSSESEEVRIQPGSYIRGRYFLLPDENIDFAAVYLEAKDGTLLDTDLRRYRKASDFEAAVSLELGLVKLAAPPAGRVLVYYEKGGVPVGDAGLGTGGLAGLNGSNQPDPGLPPVKFDWLQTYAGIDFDADLQLSIDGVDALLLYEDGAFSPFEFQAVYHLEQSFAGGTAGVELRPAGDLEALTTIDGEFGPGTLTLRPEGFPRAATRYPLADRLPQAYGPARESLLPYTLFFFRSGGTVSISVPAGATPGSVRVTINGRNEERFTRYTDGSIEFPFPILPSDDIEVSYELPDSGASGADIFFVSSNVFSPWQSLPGLELRADLGLRWNVDERGYSGEYGESPGSILAAAGASWEGHDWGMEANGGVSVGTHDTRGYLRLAGMESGTTEFGISGHSLFPAAPGAGFAAADLGELSFTDYYQYLETGGSTLREYDWSPPAEQVYPFADGNPIGPSVALAEDDDIEGQVAVLDYSLGDGEWVGAQVASPGEALDLSGATAVSFKYRLTTAAAGPLALTLRAGSVSEDLDSDNSLDEENGPYDPGFPYTHQPTGATLYVGGGGRGPRADYGNGSRESEDADGNGLLNRETPSQVFSFPFGAPLADGSWHEVYIPISAADRGKLAATRGVQLLLDSSGGASSGRLILAELRFHGSSFVPGDSASGVSEVSEDRLETAEEPILPLGRQYDLVGERFNDGEAEQKVLRLAWESGTAAAGALGAVPEVPLDGYDTLTFYYRLQSAGGVTDLTLELAGDEGSFSVGLTGISVSNRWSRVKVDLSAGTVSVDGDNPSTAQLSGNRSILVRRARFTLADAGSGPGVLFLDELHLSDPVPGVDYGLLTSAWYRREGSILSAGGLPLLSDFSWSGRSRLANPGFASGFSSPDGRVYQVYQEADFSSLYSRVELSLNVREGDDEAEVSGGHRLTVPEGGPLQIEDGYRHDPAGGEFRFTKQNALRLSLPGLEADARAEASYRTGDLSQNWSLSAGILPADELSLSPEISLANTVFDPGVSGQAYSGGWLQGTRMLAYLEESEPTDRSIRATLPIEYDPDSWWGFGFLPEAGVRRYGSDPRKELDEISLALNLPLSIFPAQFRRLDLDLRYKRAFSGEWRTGTETPEGGFPGDIAAWSSTAGKQGYLIAAPPFAEIFDTAASGEFASGTAGFDAGSYTPSTGFTLQRRFSSRLLDLLLPSFLSFETGRNYSRELDAVTSTFFTDTLAMMTAVNLFGSLGSYPLFSWYESDEISTSVTLSTRRDDEFSYGWQLKNALLLYGNGDERYSLKNSLSLEEEDERPSWTAVATALWFGEPGVRLPPPLPAVLPDGSLPRLKHTGELSFAQKPLEGGSWQRSAGLKHATGVSYGERGFIEAYVALGFNTTPLSGVDENLTFYAFEAGIVGEFNF